MKQIQKQRAGHPREDSGPRQSYHDPAITAAKRAADRIRRKATS